MILPMAAVGLGAFTSQQTQIQQMIVASANKYGVPPALALGVAAHESGFNPQATNVNTNGTTDYGVMQLNTLTVKTLGVADPYDPAQNIDAGVSLLAKYLQQYNGDETKALWAYASGPGAVAAGQMNSTASQFVDYVTNYAPQIDLGVNADTGATDTVPDPWTFGSADPGGGVTIAGVTFSMGELVLGSALLLTALYVVSRRASA